MARSKDIQRSAQLGAVLQRLRELGCDDAEGLNVVAYEWVVSMNDTIELHLKDCPSARAARMYRRRTSQRDRSFSPVTLVDLCNVLATGDHVVADCCLGSVTPLQHTGGAARMAGLLVELDRTAEQVRALIKRSVPARWHSFRSDIMGIRDRAPAAIDSCPAHDPMYATLVTALEAADLRAATAIAELDAALASDGAVEHELAKVRRSLGGPDGSLLATEMALVAFSQSAKVKSTMRTLVELTDISPGPHRVCLLPLYALPSVTHALQFGSFSARVSVALVPDGTSDQTLRTAAALWDITSDGPLSGINAALNAANSLSSGV